MIKKSQVPPKPKILSCKVVRQMHKRSGSTKAFKAWLRANFDRLLTEHAGLPVTSGLHRKASRP